MTRACTCETPNCIVGVHRHGQVDRGQLQADLAAVADMIARDRFPEYKDNLLGLFNLLAHMEECDTATVHIHH